jgi:hypothetical protein
MNKEDINTEEKKKTRTKKNINKEGIYGNQKKKEKSRHH